MAVHGVEPDGADDGRRSLVAGTITRIEAPDTLADGARTSSLGQLTFPIICDRVASVRTVPDAALVDAMRTLVANTGISVEPTGCLGFAALSRDAREFRGGRVGVILSGGNIAADRFAELVRGA